MPQDQDLVRGGSSLHPLLLLLPPAPSPPHLITTEELWARSLCSHVSNDRRASPHLGSGFHISPQLPSMDPAF